VDLFKKSKFAPDLSSASALVIMGGPMNVYETDRYPFLATELALIKEAIRQNLPVLGICLGAQLIAVALGAKVKPNKVKEIGWYPLQLAKAASDDPLFSLLKDGEMVFHWHGDTFELPIGAIHLAESKNCKNQAFRFGQSVYALQFHLETTSEMIKEWLAVPENQVEIKKALGRKVIEKIEKEADSYKESLFKTGVKFFTAFAHLIQRSKGF
jgi:GMP synthase (glutamine-hydrolysing)